MDKAEIMRNLAYMQAHLLGWAAAFSECDNVKRETDTYQNEIHEWCHTLGYALSDIAAAVTPDMISQIDIYGLS